MGNRESREIAVCDTSCPYIISRAVGKNSMSYDDCLWLGETGKILLGESCKAGLTYEQIDLRD